MIQLGVTPKYELEALFIAANQLVTYVFGICEKRCDWLVRAGSFINTAVQEVQVAVHSSQSESSFHLSNALLRMKGAI